MEKDRKFRALAIAAICVAIVGVSVAYAALSASLTISGTGTVSTENAWKISWTKLSTTEEAKATSSSAVTITQLEKDASDQKITWAATFAAPAAQMVFEATLTNGGTIPAKLVGLNKETITISKNAATTGAEATADAFTYKVEAKGSTEGDTAWKDIKTFDGWVLPSSKMINVRVTVIFDEKQTITDLTTYNGTAATFALSIPFIQATDEEVTAATNGNTIIK